MFVPSEDAVTRALQSFEVSPRIFLILSRLTTSRGLRLGRFSHASKSCAFTECSTATFEAETFTAFKPDGIPLTHSSVRIDARPSATASCFEAKSCSLYDPGFRVGRSALISYSECRAAWSSSNSASASFAVPSSLFSMAVNASSIRAYSLVKSVSSAADR